MKKTEFKGRIDVPMPAGYVYKVIDPDNVLSPAGEKMLKTREAHLSIMVPPSLQLDLWDFLSGVHLESVTLKNDQGQVIELRKINPADEKN